jgi:hypothetical protein
MVAPAPVVDAIQPQVRVGPGVEVSGEGHLPEDLPADVDDVCTPDLLQQPGEIGLVQALAIDLVDRVTVLKPELRAYTCWIDGPMRCGGRSSSDPRHRV